MSLKKEELFTHEIVKRLGAHEQCRASCEVITRDLEEPGCTVLCANNLSQITICTYPAHRYARMVVTTIGEPDVDSLSDVFREFFHPAAQSEGYLESPEF